MMLVDETVKKRNKKPLLPTEWLIEVLEFMKLAELLALLTGSSRLWRAGQRHSRLRRLLAVGPHSVHEVVIQKPHQVHISCPTDYGRLSWAEYRSVMSGGEWQSGDQNAEEEGSEEALWGCGKLCNVCLISDSEKKLPRPPESLTFGAVSIALNKETLETASNFLFPIIDRLTEHTVRAKVFARDFSATLLPRLLDALPSDSNSRFRSFALHQINGDCMVNTSLIQAILDCPVVRNTPWLRLKGLVQQSNFFKPNDYYGEPIVEKAVFRWLYHLPPASSAVKEKVQEEAPPRLAMINYFTLGDGEIFVRKLFEDFEGSKSPAEKRTFTLAIWTWTTYKILLDENGNSCLSVLAHSPGDFFHPAFRSLSLKNDVTGERMSIEQVRVLPAAATEGDTLLLVQRYDGEKPAPPFTVQSCLAPKELFPEEEEREIFIFHDDNDK